MNTKSALIVRIKISCAAPEDVLSKLSNCGISMMDVHKKDDITVIINVKPTDYKALISLLNKWQIDYSICDDAIINRITQIFKKRVILKLALLTLVIFSLYLPGHILFVNVSGNDIVSTREILEVAATSGVCMGAKSADVRSEKVKNGLLERIPGLQWVGVNTDGCVATIEVQEKTPNNNNSTKDAPIVSIIASTNGIVNSCTATQGTMLCKVGQAVSKGETLISGYTDYGIKIKATQAQGEVYALTSHTIDAVTPLIAHKKTATDKNKVRYSIRLGKKLINFNNSSGIYHGTCAKIYEEQYFVLPGGYILPISIQKETITSYHQDDECTALWANKQHFTDYIDQFLIDQMVAGKIEKCHYTIESSDHVMHIHAHYICTEMIGREKAEQFIQGDFCSD